MATSPTIYPLQPENPTGPYYPCPNPNKYFEVRTSNIHQRGVFTLKTIPEGIKLIEYIGEKISRTEALQREAINNTTGLTYLFDLNENTFIDGAVGGNESAYINHACTPNCVPRTLEGKIWIVSAREIKPNEELTYDYQFPSDDVVQDICRCGTKYCRGTIQLPK